MSLVNRSIALVTPKQPYLEWSKTDDSDGIADQAFAAAQQDPNAYLLPEIEDEDDASAMIAEVWSYLFESELGAWSADEDNWPQDRTMDMFDQWFDVQLSSTVLDLCEWELARESA